MLSASRPAAPTPTVARAVGASTSTSVRAQQVRAEALASEGNRLQTRPEIHQAEQGISVDLSAGYPVSAAERSADSRERCPHS